MNLLLLSVLMTLAVIDGLTINIKYRYRYAVAPVNTGTGRASTRVVNRLKANDAESAEVDATTGGTVGGPFVEALLKATGSLGERYFFPGHNGGQYLPRSMQHLTFQHDVPELDGLDNLHAPEGPLLQSLQQAAKLFGAFKTYFLVNGSTSGILIAILACVRWYRFQLQKPFPASSESSVQGKQVDAEPVMLIGRDAHKSVYNGLELAACSAVLLPCDYEPAFGISLGINRVDLQAAITTYGHRICGLVVTRPSYQGLAMNSEAFQRDVIDLCHLHAIPVIVDEAHGSHLRFLGEPSIQDGLTCGADLVVQSTHKTLGALSQCAMLHINSNAFRFPTGCHGDKSSTDSRPLALPSPDEDLLLLVQEAFTTLTTTSPNALLLASLDACCATMASEEWKVAMLKPTLDAANNLKSAIRRERNNPEAFLRLLDDSEEVVKRGLTVDPLRLSVQLHPENSLLVDDDMCDEDGIYCELNQQRCITYGIQIGSSQVRLQQLLQSMVKHSSRHFYSNETKTVGANTTSTTANVTAQFAPPSKIAFWNIKLAGQRLSTAVPFNRGVLKFLVGRKSAETISAYPPGIPVVLKGETFTNESLQSLLALRKDHRTGLSTLGSGCSVTGCSDTTLRTLRILDSIDDLQD